MEKNLKTHSVGRAGISFGLTPTNLDDNNLKTLTIKDLILSGCDISICRQDHC